MFKDLMLKQELLLKSLLIAVVILSASYFSLLLHAYSLTKRVITLENTSREVVLIPLVEMYEGRIEELQYQLREQGRVYENNQVLSNEFIEDRCVCVPYKTFTNERSKLSKENICELGEQS
jgi:thiamine pyrophosphokinase